VPDLVVEAYGRQSIAPVSDAFATPATHRFPAYWTKKYDAFAQPETKPRPACPWAKSPFSRLDEVVTKAAREGGHMLIAHCTLRRNGRAPNTLGGPRSVLCAPRGGALRKTVQCTSSERPIRFRPPGGGLELSCWIRAWSHDHSSQDPLLPRPALLTGRSPSVPPGGPEGRDTPGVVPPALGRPHWIALPPAGGRESGVPSRGA